jgi:hypothetical protein
MKEIIKQGDLMDIFSPFEFGIMDCDFDTHIFLPVHEEGFAVYESFLDKPRILIINNN